MTITGHDKALTLFSDSRRYILILQIHHSCQQLHTHAQSLRFWSSQWGEYLLPSYQRLLAPGHFLSPPLAPPTTRDRQKEIEGLRKGLLFREERWFMVVAGNLPLNWLTSNKNSTRVFAESKPSNSITRSALKIYTLPSSSRPEIERHYRSIHTFKDCSWRYFTLNWICDWRQLCLHILIVCSTHKLYTPSFFATFASLWESTIPKPMSFSSTTWAASWNQKSKMII